MNYIIFDLEWNQPNNPYENIQGFPFEIIEIGAVKLDENLHFLDSFSTLIKPVHYPHVNHIIHEITALSTLELNNAPLFKDAVINFLNCCGSDYRFCTWGSMDITELQRNMHYYNIPLLPFPVYYYDLQKIFSICYEDGKQRRSLEYAIEYLKLRKNMPFHRALEDARYTSLIMPMLDKNILEKYFSVDTYQLPTSKKNEIHINYGTYSKYISRCFENKTQVMEDKAVITTPCLICNRKLKKKIRWFSSNSKIYYCLCNCPEHGLVKGKIRMKKTDDGFYYAVRTLKLTDSKGEQTILERRNEIQKKRREKRKKASS